jgi:two-component system, OmpR family, response regulator RegX3
MPLGHPPPMVAGPSVQSGVAPDVLAFVETPVSLLEETLPGLRISAPEEAAVFLDQLITDHPRVALVGVPPATESVLEAVAAVRRRRPALRCVLVNEGAAVTQRLRALELGFDAAVASDIPATELGGRVALLARSGPPSRNRLPVGNGSQLDVARACLMRNGRAVHLRPKELRLLEVLARHPGRAYTRAELLDRVWGPTRQGDPRTVDVHVRWLRAKLERDPERPLHLITVRGVGYRLDPESI